MRQRFLIPGYVLNLIFSTANEPRLLYVLYFYYNQYYGLDIINILPKISFFFFIYSNIMLFFIVYEHYYPSQNKKATAKMKIIIQLKEEIGLCQKNVILSNIGGGILLLLMYSKTARPLQQRVSSGTWSRVYN